jgi:hypothetical protein
MKISPAWIVVAILIAYLLYLQQCRSKGTTAGSAVIVDTSWIINHYTSGWNKPKPDTIKLPKLVYRDTGSVTHILYPVLIDSTTQIEIKIPPTKEDTLAIIQQYLAEVHYTDSFRTKYGTVKVEDVIARNMLQRRRWSVRDSIPLVTKTKKPWLIYVGGGGYTPLRQDSLNALLFSDAEINLGYQNRKGQSFEAALLIHDISRPRVGIKFHQPIFISK